MPPGTSKIRSTVTGDPVHAPLVTFEMVTAWLPNTYRKEGIATETYRLHIAGNEITCTSKHDLHLRLVQLRDEAAAAASYIEGNA